MKSPGRHFLLLLTDPFADSQPVDTQHLRDVLLRLPVIDRHFGGGLGVVFGVGEGLSGKPEVVAGFGEFRCDTVVVDHFCTVDVSMRSTMASKSTPSTMAAMSSRPSSSCGKSFWSAQSSS